MTLDPDARGGGLLMVDQTEEREQRRAQERKARENREKRGAESEKRHGMRPRKMDD